jgi:hypothetical protein
MLKREVTTLYLQLQMESLSLKLKEETGNSLAFMLPDL